jgi:hypothetical protein
MINFESAKKAQGTYYGGDAGAKDAIVFDNAVWMIKYPKRTRDLRTPQISYTTSPLSEYLGSKIFESLKVPTHETILGTRKNRIVVACKDFTKEILPGSPSRSIITKRLIPFHDLKNDFMSSDLDSFSGTGSETLLSEVLATLQGQEDLRSLEGSTSRFWDMFVIDAFIGNNDRNNGNWGILIDNEGLVSLAPVYDNGNSFFNKRSLVQMEKRLSDINLIREDAFETTVCAYKYTGLDNEGHSINPFTFIEKGENNDCSLATLRFINNVDISAIENIIDSVPESLGSLAVMPPVQKEFYKQLLRQRLIKLKGIVPVLEKGIG